MVEEDEDNDDGCTWEAVGRGDAFITGVVGVPSGLVSSLRPLTDESNFFLANLGRLVDELDMLDGANCSC